MNILKKATLIWFVFSFSWLGGVEFLFEETHQNIIIKSEGKLEAPSLMHDRWQEKRFIELDNGLGGYITSSWDDEGQAKDMLKIIHSGPINLIHGLTDRFYLISPDSHYVTRLQSLWVNSSFKFKNLKKIASISVNTTKKSWFLNKLQYLFVIELDDGTRWATSSKDAWTAWKTGAAILMIGNSQRISFINIDEVRKKPAPVIREEHVIDVEPL